MLTTLPSGFEEEAVPLSEWVEVRRRFLRSVNLEQDFNTANPLEGYVLTSSGTAALARIAEGVRHTYARAFSITGPYGSGKSAFALFASKVLTVGNEAIPSPRARVVEQQPALRDLLPKVETEGYLPILITGARAPVAYALLNGLLDAFRQSPLTGAGKIAKRLLREKKGILESASPTSAEAAEVFVRAAELSKKSVSGCRGLLVVVDEMGKFLEYAALHPEQGDLQLFQVLAEHAVRSETTPLLLVTILHQAFEDYAHRLSATQRREWQKVQGRFADIPFSDGADETVRLIAQAIARQETLTHQDRFEQTIEENLSLCRGLSLFPSSLSASEFRELLRDTYPLHPLTLLIMPHVFRRFGQSERSLFSFLSSEEPNGFQDFLRNHALTAGAAPMLRLDHLYDYIIQTLGSTIYAHQTAKLWSETEEAVFRVRDKDPLQARLIKTIGLLHILGEQTGILPSKEALQFALTDSEVSSGEVSAELDALKTQTLIVYRHFRKAYRLYEGSDVDIEARLRDARAHFAQGTDSVQVAARLEVTRPVVARQHSYRTGTLRIFEVRHCRPKTLEAEIRAGRGQGDGAMLLCLALEAAELNAIEQIVGEALSERPEVLLGVSVETDALHEAAVAVECLLWVEAETEELRTDQVAKREVRERLSEATQAFQAEWERLLRPQGLAGEGGVWYYLGQKVPVSSHRELQHLVSKACDAAYPLTPVIQNELINRRQLSSTAAAARRNLIEAMLRHRTEPRLTIAGYPPEASMYLSVLLKTGIHRPVEQDTWAILPPLVEQDKALAAIWNEIETFLFNDELESRSLTELNVRLREKPYGITEGIMPVLICAALLYHENEVAVYEDGRFVTELDSATFERMMKQPADFKLRGCRIVGERQAVLSRFGRGLSPNGEAETLVNVIRTLYREFGRLPEYTARTRQIGEDAIALRELFKESREPEHLLFVDLPRLFGLRPFSEQEPDPENVAAFFLRWNAAMEELVGAYGALLGRIETQLCEAFAMADWEELRERSVNVASYVSEAKLTGFAVRASDTTLSRVKWLESVAAGIMSRPPAAWNDREAQRFGAQLPTLAQAFQHSELLHFEKSRHQYSEKQQAVRLAITQDTGKETARIVLVPKADTEHIVHLTRNLHKVIEAMLQGEVAEVRLAVLAQVMQELLQGEQNE